MRRGASFALAAACVLLQPLPPEARTDSDPVRFPIHPYWTRGLELREEWTGSVLLVLRWDMASPDARQTVRLAARLMDRYGGRGLVAILDHPRPDAQVPLFALRNGSGTDVLLSAGRDPAASPAGGEAAYTLYSPAGERVRAGPVRSDPPAVLEREIGRLLRMVAEGYGETPRERQARRLLYGEGAPGACRRYLGGWTGDEAGRRDAISEAERHLERKLTELRTLMEHGRIGEALALRQKIEAGLAGWPEAESAFRLEFGDPGDFDSPQARRALAIADEVSLRLAARLARAEDEELLLRAREAAPAGHPAGRRIDMLREIAFPGAPSGR